MRDRGLQGRGRAWDALLQGARRDSRHPLGPQEPIDSNAGSAATTLRPVGQG